MEETMTEPMTMPIVSGPEQHELIAQARGQCWYAVAPFGFPAFLRYRDCERLHRDPRFRQLGLDALHLSGITDGPLHDWYSLIMFANDGESHSRLRGLVSIAFTPKRMEATRAAVSADIGRLCDDVGGEVELASELAHWMPVLAVSGMLGIPREDVATFAGWSAGLGGVFSAFITPEMNAEMEAALAAFTEYVRALIEARRRRPQDDLTTRLIEARDGDDRLSEDELVAMIANIVIGGHDATERLIANAVWTLLGHPDQWRALVEDPTLIPAAVEEVLRFEPSSGGTGRIATEDVDWDGLAIPAGSIAVSMTMAANPRIDRKSVV